MAEFKLIKEDNPFVTGLVEVHGNVRYMHCSARCCDDFYLSPHPPPNSELRNENFTFVPKCPKCEFPMKPHCMFFDESYNEELHKSKTIN